MAQFDPPKPLNRTQWFGRVSQLFSNGWPLTLIPIGLLSFVFYLGCEEIARQPPEAPKTSDNNRFSEKLYLNPQLLVESFLLTQDHGHRWRFSEGTFVLESLGKPLPEKLSVQLLDEPSDDYRIAGDWKLNATRDRLLLSDLSTDLGTPRELTELPIATIGTDRIELGGVDYLYSESLPLREILPEQVYTARVVEFERGDTVRVRDEEGEIKLLRLFGVACPRVGQPFGSEAVEFGNEKTAGAEIYVKVFGVDENGRQIAQVWVAHLRYLNMELLDAGLAWHDKRSDDEWIFATAEDDARHQGKGLWSRSVPVPPWRWSDGKNRNDPQALDKSINGSDDDHHGADR